MTNSFLKKETYLKYIPFYITILFAFISTTILPPHGYAMTFSFITLICILFWSLVLGRKFGAIQFFFIGITTDFLMGTPTGSYLLLFSIIRYIALKLRRGLSLKFFYENILAATFLILVFYF